MSKLTPAKAPVDVLWIARYDYRPGWVLRRHRHNYWQMILFLDGGGVFGIRENKLPIRGGEWCLVRAGDEHGFSADSLVRTLDIKFRVAPGELTRNLRGAPFVQNAGSSGVAARLERIRREGEEKHLHYRELCGVLLTELLYLYLRNTMDTPSESIIDAADTARDQVLKRALNFIRERHHMSLTVREIARVACCTERSLRMHFHSALGIAPLAYLQRHRIERSKALIQFSDYSLKEIAEQVGFQTVHHFTRHFSALEKRSPAVWRQRYLEGIRKDIYIDPGFENKILTVGD